jgi:type II secretory pathway pseudopilin PulG
MKNLDDGFTLMETLVSIAIIMAVSSLFAIAFTTAFKATSQSNNEIKAAVTITQIDRFIRERADSLHIPYWADSKLYADTLRDELFRSKFAPYINTIQIINDSRRKPRGLLVIFTVNNRQIQTKALFPSVSIMDNVP